ncbi:MAG: 16S rRNA (guanine(966)-N(2))-methyltransferase RsmD [Chloroflexi bacterium]|nr:MAG: 16S rRNA (guanine(966)-N(2))-methyltransferase RsmD [Phototrophicales bacterium]RMF80357.1 MAG: 16S rRNA (guanine(966)-N(2))-methyltransferase RsmD [Chloroflexota bacterium]
MTLRVIAGRAKGRRLKRVPGDKTRPVMDRVKEACFNIIGADIIDATFLDLFAGTGSVGIEALSRGAKFALFVDNNKRAIATIEHNLALTKLKDHAIVRRMDAFSLLAKRPQQPYDFIYVAPPQYHELWLRSLECLDSNPAWIPSGTTVIVQIDPAEQKTVSFSHLTAYDERKYGKTLLWFFEASLPSSTKE